MLGTPTDHFWGTPTFDPGVRTGGPKKQAKGTKPDTIPSIRGPASLDMLSSAYIPLVRPSRSEDQLGIQHLQLVLAVHGLAQVKPSSEDNQRTGI